MVPSWQQDTEININIFPVNTPEIIIPNYNFPDEVHNDGLHQTDGFIQENNTSRTPISTYDPDIHTDGREHFHDVLSNPNHDETYGKYIKLRLTNMATSPLLAIVTLPSTKKTKTLPKHLK